MQSTEPEPGVPIPDEESKTKKHEPDDDFVNEIQLRSTPEPDIPLPIPDEEFVTEKHDPDDDFTEDEPPDHKDDLADQLRAYSRESGSTPPVTIAHRDLVEVNTNEAKSERTVGDIPNNDNDERVLDHAETRKLKSAGAG